MLRPALGTSSVVLGAALLVVIALNAGVALLQERHAEDAVMALRGHLPTAQFDASDAHAAKVHARPA